MLAFLADRDERVCLRVRHWHAPAWVLAWMILATRLGDGWLWLLGVALLAAGGPGYQATLAAAAAACCATNVVQVLVKRRVRRPRPSEVGVTVRRVAAPDRYSFPSGHSMNAFAFASVVAPDVPLLAPALGFVAASVAASRVVLGLHYPTDVAAGALLGSLIALVARALVF